MKRKKVLIITYYWPPGGGIAVLRCLKLAKYIREFGWEPVIFTAEGAHYPSIDHSNDKDVPENATILRQKIWEPYRFYKLFTGKPPESNVNDVFYVQEDKDKWTHRLSVWIRSNFFIPDARALWISPSVKKLTAYLKDHPVDAILSTGPPHSNTRIATLLKKKTGLPWLADFQDPWTQVDYFQHLILSKWAERRHKRMEQEVFEWADKITIVSPTWKDDLIELGARNVEVVPLGYDADDFSQIQQRELGPKFTFTHLGMLGYDRNPKVFFEVLNRLCREVPGFKDVLEIRMIGPIDPAVLENAGKQELSPYISTPGTVSREKALQLTCRSPILLLLLNQQPNAKGRIPGKLFEYLAARRPVLTLGPVDSDVAQIIKETKSGVVCDYNDFEGIKNAVILLFEKYRSGQLQNVDSTDIENYSMRTQGKRFAQFLNEITQ
jgi:glycosyltransferase involved in cell wall biosynthesis